jgi:hypothetical protein
MNVITRWRIKRSLAPVPDYMTPAEHREEAERLAWVVDYELQSDAERTLGDVIALARLHLELAREAGVGEVMPP